MKKIKKFLGLFMSMLLMLAGGVSVTAATGEPSDTYTITIQNSKEGHTYEAYQVFTGRLEVVDGANVLSDIDWGNGVDDNTLITELKLKSPFNNCITAADVAKVMSDANKNKELAKEFAKIVGRHLAKASGTFTSDNKGTYTISGLEAGYYLVKDKDNTVPGDDAYTEFILKVTNNITATPKSSVPTVEKKVQENSDQTWQDAADYNIGDSVSFRLTGTLPENYASYETYSYTFHDTLSRGLTLIENTIHVKIGNTDVTNYFSTKTSELNDSNCTFEVTCSDLKKIESVELSEKSKIVVEYQAQLNENAVIAGLGNPNEVYLEFSNNPNGGGTGKTPTDKVVVFTYELVVNKKDENQNSLNGAAFTLYKQNGGQWDVVKEYEASTSAQFKFTGLDAGTYQLKETKAPAGYNSIEPIVFTIISTYDKESDDSRLTALEIQDDNKKVISGEQNLFKVTLQPDDNASNIVTDVINKKGATLPETGGIGTKIFYVAGCILVIGAAIALFTKKRMKKEN